MIGIVLLATVVPITLPVARAASNVACLRRNRQVASMVICPVQEVMGLAEVAVVAVATIALDGNPVIGFALGQDAMSTISLVEWNVSDAMHRGTLVACPHMHHKISNFCQGT